MPALHWDGAWLLGEQGVARAVGEAGLLYETELGGMVCTPGGVGADCLHCVCGGWVHWPGLLLQWFKIGYWASKTTGLTQYGTTYVPIRDCILSYSYTFCKER